MRIYNAYAWTPFKYSGGETMERLGWTQEALDEFLAQHFDGLFMNYAEQHGKRRWGEKSPLHTWHVPNMARLFPHAQFVMLMRHPAASVHSNLRRFTRYTSNPDEPRKHWNWYGRLIAQHSVLLGDRMTFLRYEHLVLQPERAVGELLEWLGEPPSDSVLRHHEVQAARGGSSRTSGKSRVDEPIDTSRIDRWRSALPEAERNRIARSPRPACALLRLRRARPVPARASARRRRAADLGPAARGTHRPVPCARPDAADRPSEQRRAPRSARVRRDRARTRCARSRSAIGRRPRRASPAFRVDSHARCFPLRPAGGSSGSNGGSSSAVSPAASGPSWRRGCG